MNSDPAVSNMRVSTFFDNTPAEACGRESLLADVGSARMSKLFRAYYRLRPLIPLRARQLLQRRRNATVEVATDWYLPTEFFRRSALALAESPTTIIHPWPHGSQSAFVLTHDIETADGLRRIPEIAAIEEELGFRSSWNLVPHKYPIDRGLVRDLCKRGFEIGIHGFNHDGKLFLSEAIFRQRAEAINEALRDYECVGFRAPMVHRNLSWLQALDVEYDASCFDVDPFQAMPGGVGSLWPAIVGNFVELPYTLPQDHTLFVTRGEATTRIWEDKLNFIQQSSGMALMLTHPDYLDTQQRQGLYRDFLAQVRDAGSAWHALPREVAQWWRQRERSRLVQTEDGGTRIEGPAEESAVVSELRSDSARLQIHVLPGQRCALGNPLPA